MFKNLLEQLFVERMDQNEEIFVRFMNDVPFQKIVTTWMAAEAYRRLRSDDGREASWDAALPARLRIVEPKPDERYVTCVPLVPLKAAAGAFGDPQHVEDDGFEWVCRRRASSPAPPECSSPKSSANRWSRRSRTARTACSPRRSKARDREDRARQLRDTTDPETGERYTVKRYESEKARDGDSWRHAKITLKPLNPDFEPIVLTGADQEELQVIAEVVEVLDPRTIAAGALTVLANYSEFPNGCLRDRLSAKRHSTREAILGQGLWMHLCHQW